MDFLVIENKAVGVMKVGHSFTIEPMINEGGWRDEQWPDHWTAVTADGSRSAQVLLLLSPIYILPDQSPLLTNCTVGLLCY